MAPTGTRAGTATKTNNPEQSTARSTPASSRLGGSPADDSGR